MRKSDVIAHLADAAEVSKKTAAQMLEALTDLARKETRKGFALPGLGKLLDIAPGRPAGLPAQRVDFSGRGVTFTLPKKKTRIPGPIEPIKALHDPVNGRVDAERVARYLNEPLAFIANALQRKYSTVAKTPAAASLQPRLLDFKRVIEVLEHVLGDARSVRIWMNTPHPDLDDMTPRAVAENGNISVIRRMIDSALSGNLT